MQIFAKQNSKNLKGTKRAETLLEVIIAIGMIAMGAATAAQLVVTSLQTITYNKDALVALDLAQEGIEYMRNLRDSNWIKFSSNTDCWNLMPGESACDDTPSSRNNISTAYFALGDSIDSGQTDDLDLNSATATINAPFQLNYYDLDTNVDSDGDGGAWPNAINKKNDKDLLSSSLLSGLVVSKSQYYRSVQVQYFAIDANGNVNSSVATNGDVMLVTSKVQWFGMSRVNTLTLQSSLSKYR